MFVGKEGGSKVLGLNNLLTMELWYCFVSKKNAQECLRGCISVYSPESFVCTRSIPQEHGT